MAYFLIFQESPCISIIVPGVTEQPCSGNSQMVVNRGGQGQMAKIWGVGGDGSQTCFVPCVVALGYV